MKRSHEILIDLESAHQDTRISKLNQRPIRHASLENYAKSSHLHAFFARPFLDSKKPLRVLELGSGTGGTAIRLARVGHHVCAIDVSRQAIEYARKGAIEAGVQDRITFLLHDATELSSVFKPGEYDAICGIGILHHLDSLESVLRQIRNLSPRILAFIEALGTNPLHTMIRKLLVNKSHTADEHPLVEKDLCLIQELFPDARMLFGGTLTPHPRLRFKPLWGIDHFVSNLGPFWYLAKTVAIVFETEADVPFS